MISYIEGDKSTRVDVWKFPDGAVGVNINSGDAEVNTLRTEIQVLIEFGEYKDVREKLWKEINEASKEEY